MPKQKIIWQCDFCQKTYVQKSKVVKHELICLYNLKNKCCATCEKMSKYDTDERTEFKGNHYCSEFDKILTTQSIDLHKDRMTYKKNCIKWTEKEY